MTEWANGYSRGVFHKEGSDKSQEIFDVVLALASRKTSSVIFGIIKDAKIRAEDGRFLTINYNPVVALEDIETDFLEGYLQGVIESNAMEAPVIDAIKSYAVQTVKFLFEQRIHGKIIEYQRQQYEYDRNSNKAYYPQVKYTNNTPNPNWNSKYPNQYPASFPHKSPKTSQEPEQHNKTNYMDVIVKLKSISDKVKAITNEEVWG